MQLQHDEVTEIAGSRPFYLSMVDSKEAFFIEVRDTTPFTNDPYSDCRRFDVTLKQYIDDPRADPKVIMTLEVAGTLEYDHTGRHLAIEHIVVFGVLHVEELTIKSVNSHQLLGVKTSLPWQLKKKRLPHQQLTEAIEAELRRFLA